MDRKTAWFGHFVRDIRFAARALRRTPGFTFASVSSLACGMALVASTLAVVNAYLVRSLPYPESSRLYHVFYAPPGQREPRGLSALDWSTLRDVVDIADNSTAARFYLRDSRYTEEAQALLVAPGSLETLGVRTVMGRSLQADDFHPNAERVALIGHSLWRDRFGSDPQVVGRLFRANLADTTTPPDAFRVVGVLPPGFRWVREYARDPIEIVTPLRTPTRTYMVRLRQGVTPAAAQHRITEATRAIATGLPPAWRGVQLESVQERYVATVRPMLIAITVAAGLVLLIVIANVAILTLLRTLRRQKEIAVRLALGGARRHIVRLLAAEVCLICAAAIAISLSLTASALDVLAPFIEAQLGRPVPGGAAALGIDSTVLMALGGVGALVALSLSFVPLLAPWQRRLAERLRSDSRTATDRKSMRWARSGLIAVEVAGSLALLVGCGLMIRSAVNLMTTDLGYRTESLVRSRVALPAGSYADPPAFLTFYERLTDQLSARANAPVAFSSFPALFDLPGRAVESDAGNSGAMAGVLGVSPAYFEALDIRLVEGRQFTPADRLGTEPVAVISQSLARRLWPAGSAVGHRLRAAVSANAENQSVPWRTVVGVARDVRQTFTDDNLNDIYTPLYQDPSRYAPVLIRSDRPPSFWLDTLRGTVAEIDPEVLVGPADSLEIEADRLLAGTRFLTSMLTVFAVFAAFLAVLGIYGVTSYATQQREPEVAIRMALGATGEEVVRMFVKSGGFVIAGGLALGLFAAVALARTLENQLHGVPPFDPSTLIVTCMLMAAGGLVATWWPARRTTLKNPSAVLKEQ